MKRIQVAGIGNKTRVPPRKIQKENIREKHIFKLFQYNLSDTEMLSFLYVKGNVF